MYLTAISELQGASLEQLVEISELYGSLAIFASKDEPSSNRYNATIRFSTVANIQLEATSDFRLPFKQALIEAILKANEVVNSVNANAPKSSEIDSILLGTSKQDM